MAATTMNAMNSIKRDIEITVVEAEAEAEDEAPAEASDIVDVIWVAAAAEADRTVQRREYQDGVLAPNEAVLQHNGVLLVYLTQSILSKLLYLPQKHPKP